MKRLFLLVFSSFFFLFLFPFISKTAEAQAPTPLPTVPVGTWYNPSINQFYDKVVNSPENEMFAERYTFAQVNWIINSLSLLFQFNLLDENFLDGLKNQLLIQNPTTPNLAEYFRFGPSGFLILTIGDVFRFRPVSGIESISSTLAKFDLATPAHAQGYGYLHLGGVQFLWTAARNTAYLVIAVLLIVAGFMVILRTKISPQAVVTIQMIIPRLVITLILVTFSYAIAGLVIDLIYFIVAITISAFSLSGVVEDLRLALGYFANPGFWKIFCTYALGFLAFIFNPQFVVYSIVIPPIIWLIFAVCMFFLLIRIWWMMMKTYLTLILLIITGPWFIMMGLLPNSHTGFGSWLRNVFAHASVFAVVPIMFIINLTLYDFNEGFNIFTGSFSAALNWINDNLIGYGNLQGGINDNLPAFPLFGAKSGGLSGFFLSMAILALMPKIADMIRDAIKTPPFKYGSAFGEALGAAAIVTAPLGRLGGAAKGVGADLMAPSIAKWGEQLKSHIPNIPTKGPPTAATSG